MAKDMKYLFLKALPEAQYRMLDENTLVIKFVTVPLLAEEGARYVSIAQKSIIPSATFQLHE